MIEFRDLEVTYPNGFKALKGIDLTIPKGQFVVIVGLSGCLLYTSPSPRD